MKRILWIILLTAVSLPLSAQTINLTAKNQGYYIVTVDGAKVSQHTAEREAVERAVNEKLAKPEAVVEYTHDYRVVVTLEGATPPPTPEPTAGLQWDPVAAATGYKVHFGLLSGKYDQVIDVGASTTYVVGNLQLGQTYFFVVTAYNADGESGYSNEVSKGF